MENFQISETDYQQLNRLGRAAIEYAKNGFAVFPLVRGTKTPHSAQNLLYGRDKVDANGNVVKDAQGNVKKEGGVKIATTDLAKIVRWWLAEPDSNIAIATGKISDCFVVDVDMGVKENGKGEKTEKNGDKAWAAILENAGVDEPETSVARTTSGGLHYFFKYQAKPETTTDAGVYHALFDGKATNIDIRNDGGYVVAAPSVVNGKAYAWIAPTRPDGKNSAKSIREALKDCPAAIAGILGTPKPESDKKEKPKVLDWDSVYTAFLENIKKMQNTPPYPTSIPWVDEKLDGGFLGGELYVLGGITGLGKTAFCLQIALENLKIGHSVIFCNLEMPPLQIMARLFSRLSWQIAESQGRNFGLSVSAFLNGGRNLNGGSEKVSALVDAIVSDNLIPPEWQKRLGFIDGAVGGRTADYLGKALKEFITENKPSAPPLFIVDYLQLVEKENAFTDKQKVDAVVKDLKAIAAAFNVPVIAISALSRASYEGNVTLNAFKESGLIEYAASGILAIQYDYDSLSERERKTRDGKDKKGKALQQALVDKFQKDCNDETTRYFGKLELALLKNRHGGLGTTKLRFSTKKNVFEQGYNADESTQCYAADLQNTPCVEPATQPVTPKKTALQIAKEKKQLAKKSPAQVAQVDAQNTDNIAPQIVPQVANAPAIPVMLSPFHSPPAALVPYHMQNDAQKQETAEKMRNTWAPPSVIDDNTDIPF